MYFYKTLFVTFFQKNDLFILKLSLLNKGKK